MSVPEDPRIARAKQAITQDPSIKWTIEKLAGIACISPHHFARIFKRSTGVSAIGYVRAQRISRARMMLLAGPTSLAMVAAACGFSSQAHMTSSFKRALGVTPGQVQSGRQTAVNPAESDSEAR